ncbi:nitronate monooxygenase family protein [Acidiferrimicrobium sp. IK]|uniref:nitronate monooxygenase n=1 Tax=Acidiferrimicrobium sp. IK TaxID=2871700 RepID=UPI0021CB8F58|nr:nitronate monooxygenase family protein [Acidiferrimicrobium sp. IK]MCU4185054.1 nitronate monooxygenase family protein [Acidiferrimicrobium sp. IK]
MNTAVCRLLGIEFPLLAFSHCRDVVAAVTNAGGFGVLGAAAFSPEQLDRELTWIDEHTDGRPYGADVLVPLKVSGEGMSRADIAAMVPDEQRRFVASVLADHDVQAPEAGVGAAAAGLGSASGNEDLLDVAFTHPIRLIANALGPPPPSMLERARAAGVPVAALVGARQHAERQLAAGVDILVAQGSEAGGHCGEVSTMVLVPEVVDAAAAMADGKDPVPVLAAGGIVDGRQMAAALALGASGVWTGSVWLTTEEAETAPATKAKMIAASSRDTVRSTSRTGKPSRQLRSAWTDAWSAPGAPATLPMPLQSVLSEPALRKVDQLAASGHAGATELATYWIGQGVGLLDAVKPARRVVAEFMEAMASSLERIDAITRS